MKRHFTLIMTLLLVSTFISAEETYQEKVKNVYLKYACLYKYGPNVSYESLSSSEKAGLKIMPAEMVLKVWSIKHLTILIPVR